jgi:hypothetical protein
MDWAIVITESILIGIALSTILTIMIVVSLLVNKEMWLQDYPPDVKAKWGPMSQKAKRQRAVFAIIFFGVLIGAMVYAVIRLEQVLGMSLSFLAVFASIVIVLVVFNLTDAVIIDWLILMVLWPGLVVLPGTEEMAGYKDMQLWTRNFLKGFVFAPITGLLVAGIYTIFFR